MGFWSSKEKRNKVMSNSANFVGRQNVYDVCKKLQKHYTPQQMAQIVNSDDGSYNDQLQEFINKLNVSHCRLV
jgi:hypothetical protein